MASPWKPARRCSGCFYPNDSDANYCQACGTLTRPRRSAAPVPPLDETAIQERFDEFQSVFRSKPYERRKSAWEQLERYCIFYASREGFPKSSFWDTPVSHPDNLNYVLLRFWYYGSHFSVLFRTRMGRSFLSSGE